MNFDDHCQKIAKDFIQSVMVVDDQAYLRHADVPKPYVVTVPKSRSLFPSADGQATSPDLESSSEVLDQMQDEISHALDGMVLTRSFAKIGVACSIYRPEQVEGSEEIEDTISIARHADVVILDWRLGSDPVKAKTIVRRILKEDEKENGRHRLIAIYTGEGDLNYICKELNRNLTDAGINLNLTDTKNTFALTKPSIRIVFINKIHAKSSVGSRAVSEKELPDRLIEEFAEMSRGIMPAVALGSITAIRNSTHHILAKFHAGLDGALAAHRAFIKYPEDTEIYAADLVAEEMKTILEVTKAGAANAGIEVFDAWVDYISEAGYPFRTSTESSASLTPTLVKEILRNGFSVHEKLRTSIKPNPAKDIFAKSIYDIFHSDPRKVDASIFEFARLDALKREAYGTSFIPPDWTPTLTLGTIIKASDTGVFYVCIQPVCDAVRVPDGRRFPMVPLQEITGNKKFSFVLKLEDGKDICVEPDHHPYNIEQFVFEVNVRFRTIRGYKDDLSPKYFFKTSDGRSFEWMGDLKGFLSMRLIQRSAGQVSRVGLDQFEWLRSKG